MFLFRQQECICHCQDGAVEGGFHQVSLFSQEQIRARPPPPCATPRAKPSNHTNKSWEFAGFIRNGVPNTKRRLIEPGTQTLRAYQLISPPLCRCCGCIPQHWPPVASKCKRMLCFPSCFSCKEACRLPFTVSVAGNSEVRIKDVRAVGLPDTRAGPEGEEARPPPPSNF